MTSVSSFQLRRWFFFILGMFLVIGSGPATFLLYAWLGLSGLVQPGEALLWAVLFQLLLAALACIAYSNGIRMAMRRIFFGSLLLWASGFAGFLAITALPNAVDATSYGVGAILAIASAVMIMQRPRRQEHFIGVVR